MDEFDIAIVGGGMVGQSFALSVLQQSKLSVAIIEPNSPKSELNEEFHIRVSAITPKSEDFLSRHGVWDLIERKHAFTRTKVWDQNSHGKISFGCDEEGLPYLGNIVENDAIQCALFRALASTPVTHISSKLIAIESDSDGYIVQLDNTNNVHCKLLVGADGALSRTRELAGIEFSDNDYSQQAIICNVSSTESFEDTTWQRFLSNSIVAILPLSDNEASIVWSAENPLADELTSLTINEFAERLSLAVEYRVGHLKVVSEVKAFPLIERSAKEYVKEYLALVGDAAHNIHPLAGQGVNLGFADAQELSNQITQSNKPIGDYSVLRKYARSRRFDNELMAKTMTGLNWIYKENNEPVRWIRGIGMNIIDDNPAIKSFFQRHALGE